MADKPLLELDYAILCDEIRVEESKKLILLGVYTGDVLVGSFPATLGLSAYLHGFAYETGSVTLEVRYRIDFEEAEPTILTAVVEIELLRAGKNAEINVSLPKAGVKLPEPGRLAIDYRIAKGRWKNLLRKKITLFENATSEPAQRS